MVASQESIYLSIFMGDKFIATLMVQSKSTKVCEWKLVTTYTAAVAANHDLHALYI